MKHELFIKRIIILSLACIGIVSLKIEGYINQQIIPFLIYGIFITVISFFIVKLLSLKRLIFICIISGSLGYLTQIVGIKSNVWSYTKESFYFVIFCFAQVYICIVGFSIFLYRKLPILFRKLHLFFEENKKICVLINTSLFLILIIFLYYSCYKNINSYIFCLYYFILCICNILLYLKLNPFITLSVIVIAWCLGYFSEYVGILS
jgi:hypothetical protein